MKEYSKHTNELARLRRLEKNPIVEKPCPNCSKPFEARQISRKIYCSFECVQIAYHNRKKLERHARGLKPKGRPKGSVSEKTVEPLEPIERKTVNLNTDSFIGIPCASCLANDKKKESEYYCNPSLCQKLTEWLLEEGKKHV